MQSERLLAAAIGILIGTALTVSVQPGHVHAQAGAGTSPDVIAMRAEIDALKRQLPDQAHVMAEVDYHFSSLWFAARNANWPLAAFYLGEMRSHLNWAVRMRPVRKLSSGADLELRPILQGVESAGLAQIKAAIEQHDQRAFDRAYRGAIAQCYGCHAAAEKPYLRPRIPDSPGARMIDPRG